MTSLFIDSTYDITLGILDDGLGWINFERFIGQKASNVIQKETYKFLQQNSLKVSGLSSIISIAGPGFYTGLRLSEGFADVMTFSGIKHYSFLSYDIPFLSGEQSGVWMTKAYRGEYFFHHWNGSESKNVLISAKELENYLSSVKKSSLYIHSESAIDDFSRQYMQEWRTTYDILRSSPQLVFSQVINSQTRVESFYFRAPEDEFKVSI